MATSKNQRSYGVQCHICGKTAFVQAGRWGWATKKFRDMGWRFRYPIGWECPEAAKAERQA